MGRASSKRTIGVIEKITASDPGPVGSVWNRTISVNLKKDNRLGYQVR